ncbi:hypothetical protein [Pseudohoeflea coraliihabitans]|uniref:Phasin domain-containing protein n=1 Tax=Pseudohoeflea coraliihabitans TaxID=2860393 RepID=A0ABS6WUB7_9HYPH|nr:hypothetical protein [Pseudohoeflea sp. DP4N28-3]MBW3098654.1 hypothetical protein [Pseudohoeflea sp. DP4N28-3]
MNKLEAPLPNSVTIPSQIIEKWVDIPETQFLDLRVTRVDMDRLYFSFDNMARAQALFQDAIIAHSNGQVDEANHLNHESRRLLIEAQNAHRLFFMALMSSVVAK